MVAIDTESAEQGKLAGEAGKLKGERERHTGQIATFGYYKGIILYLPVTRDTVSFAATDCLYSHTVFLKYNRERGGLKR